MFLCAFFLLGLCPPVSTTPPTISGKPQLRYMLHQHVRRQTHHPVSMVLGSLDLQHPSTIKHYQPSLSITKHQQPSSVIKHQQSSSTIKLGINSVTLKTLPRVFNHHRLQVSITITKVGGFALYDRGSWGCFSRVTLLMVMW